MPYPTVSVTRYQLMTLSFTILTTDFHRS